MLSSPKYMMVVSYFLDRVILSEWFAMDQFYMQCFMIVFTVSYKGSMYKLYHEVEVSMILYLESWCPMGWDTRV